MQIETNLQFVLIEVICDYCKSKLIKDNPYFYKCSDSTCNFTLKTDKEYPYLEVKGKR